MKIPAFAALLAVASAYTSVLSDLPTFTSTIISSTCPSSRAYYGNYTILEQDSYIYETEYVTDPKTLTMRQTICSDNGCTVTTILNTLTTVVTTVDGILTTYVTASPVTVTFNDDTSTMSSSNVAVVTTEISASAEAKSGTLAPKTFSPAFSQEIIDSETQTTATSVESSLYPNNANSNVESLKVSSSPEPNVASATTSGLKASLVSSTMLDNSLQKVQTAQQTTVVTVTECSEDKCQETSMTTGVTVVTSTVNGVETVYTTFCPLSEAPILSTSTAVTDTTLMGKSTNTDTMDHDITSHVVSTVRSFDKHSAATTISDVHTTVVTTTYCNENECSVSPVTTGVSYFTTIVHGTKTTYTTYCPLSTMIETVSSEIASSIDTTNGPNSVSIVSATDNIAATSSIKTFTVNAPAESTVNVITNNILTQTKTVSAVSTPGSSIKTQSTAIISSFEGAAARAFPAAIVLPFIYFLL